MPIRGWTSSSVHNDLLHFVEGMTTRLVLKVVVYVRTLCVEYFANIDVPIDSISNKVQLSYFMLQWYMGNPPATAWILLEKGHPQCARTCHVTLSFISSAWW